MTFVFQRAILESALMLTFAGMLVALVPAAATASELAWDDAAQAVYDDGWQSGDDGGEGWGGPWTLDSGGFGVRSYVVGDSETNGLGAGPGINTSGRSWGIRAGNDPDGLGDAIRTFDGALEVGQQVLLALDAGILSPPPQDAAVGFGLRSGSTNRFEFFFSGSTNTAYLFDSAGFKETGFAATTTGLDLEFTLTGLNEYSLHVTRRDGGGEEVFSGTLGGASDTGIDRFRTFNFRSGDGIPESDAFINSIQIVPEPASLLFLVLSGRTLPVRRRSK